MKSIFPHSKELRQIVESYDWTLYDVPYGKAPVWEELDKQSPSEQFKISHMYLFVPIPKKGQTLREAYTPAKGLGPSLRIEDPSDDRWGPMIVRPKSELEFERGFIALFSRLEFDKKYAIAMSPRTYYLPDPDIVAMNYDKLVDTFRTSFRVVTPEEFGLTTPVPMPPPKEEKDS